ncbi:signal peptide-containing protein [Theileria equi strain WA]|uniref:Signal peptide-containing protein n=1 Tax=Theileria equi strain WA TaxID=1537102 RepID=L0B1N9_THEEQ|nr:signal peptide-containing protein [Theileria equi strain WA]AFZ81044.1 signal peptide-containing protein [Theileria equi strain WA]|eukprot:XP_004830710.1 signal peptide-containing protein [Theileria equi strain WA]
MKTPRLSLFVQLWLFPGHILATILFDSIMNDVLKLQGEELDKIGRFDLETRVGDAISKASQLLGLDNFESSECEPDFSHFCPEGWVYSGDGVHCKADFEYEGPCERVLDFSNKTPLDKLEMSKTCGFSWPCRVKDYPVDGNSFCPRFWRYDGKNA